MRIPVRTAGPENWSDIIKSINKDILVLINNVIFFQPRHFTFYIYICSASVT